ncbi:MAG: AAA family ATPase [Rhodospirillales bacterium]|nr:AAA family ATPase [Rhodospirillales bacterium]
MHFIPDDVLFQRLAFDNPWWAGGTGAKPKFHDFIKRAYFSAFFSRFINPIGTEPLLLAGPSGAGKTVMIRQAVAQLLETGVAPTSIFYCSLTTPSYTGASLERLLDVFAARYGHGLDSEINVFLDDVQYIKNWQTTVRALAGKWPKGRIAVSVFSGATTGGKDDPAFVLPPLTFLEFLRFRGSEEKLFGAGAGKGSAQMSVSPEALKALNAEFNQYVNFGGFPKGVSPQIEDISGPAFIRDELAAKVLHKDLASLAGINDIQELNRLFAILAFNTAREVTIEELTKAVGVAKNTLRKYLDYLEHAFLIRRLPRVDRQAKPFQRAVAFKVYLTAPCLYAALFGPASPDSDAFPRLAETALVSQWLGSEAVGNLAYASWRGGTIDLLSLNPATGKPDHVFEIDWRDTYAGGGKGPENLTAFVKETNPTARAYIMTHTTARQATMSGTEITLAPLALYAYWMERASMLSSFDSAA